MSDFLKEFVTRAGIALEAEDRRLAGAARIRNEVGGIRQAGDNERFFQAIVWRAAYDRWPARMEHEKRDLMIFTDITYREPLCEFEMKTWLGPGNPNVSEIVEDIRRLESCGAPASALIIFSANDRGCRASQLAIFERLVFEQRVLPIRREEYCFNILYIGAEHKVEDQEFWIAVWPIKPGPLLE